MTIEIIVDTKGEATVQTRGFSGATCKDASRFIERTLGEVRHDTATPEMYQPATLQQPAQQNTGR
ncbi:MAG: DUF2997 domain-containing protein [Tepidisphaeraceae bacterium]|jgi:hypothetical protein